ncbi:MAG: hypothetical protein ACK5EA_11630 [Planctomycetaceae bacterium]|jgi:Zn finger protein HypA/HybF involved in hydrogenase expression
MTVFEMIQLEGRPFPKPLPVPVDHLLTVLAKYGFRFETPGNSRVITLREEYRPDRFAKIKHIVDQEMWDISVKRKIWPEYSQADYEMAPLCMVIFPDIFIDEIDFIMICPDCGRKRVKVDMSYRVEQVMSTRPLLSVNGQFKIVSRQVKTAIESTLIGSCFNPFDLEKRYYHLHSLCNVGNLVIHPEEVIGYLGLCTTCGNPKLESLFGPWRYLKSNWSGEDVVNESFLGTCLFSSKAFFFLKELDHTIARDGIALLEN